MMTKWTQLVSVSFTRRLEMQPEKVEAIFEVANKLFVKQGYMKTSVDEIARDAMIAKGTIYNYFDSKESIFLALLEKVFAEAKIEIMSKIDQANTFEDKFRAFILEPIKSFVSDYQLMLQILNEDSPIYFKKLREFRAKLLREFSEILESIFKFGTEQGVIKPKYAEKIEKIVEMMFACILVGGANVKINITEHKLQEFVEYHMLHTEILIDGFTNKEQIT